MIIEDTHTSYMQGFGPARCSFMCYVEVLTDRMDHRFGLLSDRSSEQRVWSLRIYDSVVAFVIHRRAKAHPSAPTDNGGADDAAIDMRYAGNAAHSGFVRLGTALQSQFAFLAAIPGVRFLHRHVEAGMLRRIFRARRYFK